MSDNSPSGVMLTVSDVDLMADRIVEMWTRYNVARRNALELGEEARQYVFATDIDSTTASILPHKNRTHQPKLTELSDTLQSQYYEATLSTPKFFIFEGVTEEDHRAAKKVEAWLRHKLESKKFRETVGRQLIADFTNYGNCFAEADYVREVSSDGKFEYQGPVARRISPLDLVMNPRSDSFKNSVKIRRVFVHIAALMRWPEKFPNANWNIENINKVIQGRHNAVVEDWVKVLKERGLQIDGYGTLEEYFDQDMVEILVYRGDVFDPETGSADTNRIVYVADRSFIIRNEPNPAPRGFDGLHHAGWRVRNDNLWAQGPLDNLVGMQYRIDHLENLKADIFDQIAQPIIKIKGDDVQEPESGYAPGAVYYMGLESDVEFDRPDPSALNANTEIQLYHRFMEQFAGALPESRGVRTPGEKTAFEVSVLAQGRDISFLDKARNFERLLETLLEEMFNLLVTNFDEEEYIRVTNDITGAEKLVSISREDVYVRGKFKVVGSRHWQRRQRIISELANLINGPLQDPKIRSHVSGETLAKMLEETLDYEDENLVQKFVGVKEDIHAQSIAQSEARNFSDEETEGPVRVGDVSGTGDEVNPGREGEERGNQSG